MDVLRTAVSAFDPDVADNSPAALRKGISSPAVPMIATAHEQTAVVAVPPGATLGHAANFL